MKFSYIAIEREYASGGSEIGRKAAGLLNIPCYGKEILEITAKRKNISVEYIEELEENSTGSFLFSLYRMTDTQGNPDAITAVNIEEINVIRELAGNGPAVFVGRTAAYALKERADVLKVFVHASDAYREKRACEVYGVERDSVKSTLKTYDKRRAAYYKKNFGTDWKNYGKYDLVLDSSTLGIDKCAAIIAESAR